MLFAANELVKKLYNKMVVKGVVGRSGPLYVFEKNYF